MREKIRRAGNIAVALAVTAAGMLAMYNVCWQAQALLLGNGMKLAVKYIIFSVNTMVIAILFTLLLIPIWIGVLNNIEKAH